jgi:hypothetical protein
MTDTEFAAMLLPRVAELQGCRATELCADQEVIKGALSRKVSWSR